jgi:hypothetical protein
MEVRSAGADRTMWGGTIGSRVERDAVFTGFPGPQPTWVGVDFFRACETNEIAGLLEIG